jgi:hypothetical protein
LSAPIAALRISTARPDEETTRTKQ